MNKKAWMPVLFVVVVGLLFAPGAQAGLRFSPPQDLSPPGQDASDPRLAVDPQGRATVAWMGLFEDATRVLSVRVGDDGTPGPVQTLSGARASNPQVAVDPQGRATVVWQQWVGDFGDELGMQALRVGADGTPGPIHTLTEPTYLSPPIPPAPRVAVDSEGRSTVVDLAGGSIRAIRLRPDGSPELVRILSDNAASRSPEGDFVRSQPELAVDGHDRVTVVWEAYVGNHIRVQSVRLGADGTPGAVKTLSRGDRDVEPQLAVDPKGGATVVWRHMFKPRKIQAVRVSPGGDPGAVRTLARRSFDAEVAVDRRGRATAVWVFPNRKKGTYRVRSVRLDANGRRGTVRTLSKSEADSPQVAVDPKGRATVVWTWGKRGSGIQRIQARRVPRRGAPEAVRTLSDPGQDAWDPKVEVDSQGRPSVVWWVSGGGIQSTRGE